MYVLDKRAGWSKKSLESRLCRRPRRRRRRPRPPVLDQRDVRGQGRQRSRGKKAKANKIHGPPTSQTARCAEKCNSKLKFISDCLVSCSHTLRITKMRTNAQLKTYIYVHTYVYRCRQINSEALACLAQRCRGARMERHRLPPLSPALRKQCAPNVGGQKGRPRASAKPEGRSGKKNGECSYYSHPQFDPPQTTSSEM